MDLLVELNRPGAAGLTALRELLRLEAARYGEEDFPYSLVAETLLNQQMVIFGGPDPNPKNWAATAREWGQAAWLDRLVRSRLGNCGVSLPTPGRRLYPAYLHFAEAAGLPVHQLPATQAEFDSWAASCLTAWDLEGYHRAALHSMIHLSPVFWPVNLAIILYLLPESFFGRYRETIGKEGVRLVAVMRGIFTEMTGYNSNNLV